MNLRAAAVQMDARPYAVAENVAHAQALVEQAARDGAQLVVLPELFNTGYQFTDRNFTIAEPLDGPTGTWVVETARRLDIHLLGTFPARIDGDAYITALLAAPDGRTWYYCKNHVALWENLYFRRGTDSCVHTLRARAASCGLRVAQTDIGRIGIIICWDIVFADLARRYRDRIDLLCIASAPPNLGTGVIRADDGRDVLDLQGLPWWQEAARRGASWFLDGTRRHARCLGVPVVHALRCGMFESPLPWPALGLFALSPSQAWRVWQETRLRFTCAAPFMAHSLVCDRTGMILASLGEEEAVVAATVEVTSPRPEEPMPRERFMVPDMMNRLVLLDGVLARLRPVYYWLRKRSIVHDATP